MSTNNCFQLGPVVAGPMAQYTGWRNFWWLNAAMLAFVTLLTVVAFPETKWHRTHPSEMQAEKLSGSHPSSQEKVAIENTEVVDAEKEPIQTMPSLTHEPTAARDPYLHKGKPNRKQFLLFQSAPNPIKTFLFDFILPWKLLAFPIVEFASFVVSWSASSFLTLNLTQTQAFAAPPYNFSSTAVGFTNFAIFVGAILGLFTAGPLSDYIAAVLTRRNKGIREPEMRLPTMIPYVLIMILGNFIVAFGYQHQWNWKVSFP